jgi:RNA polymerase-binding protein DksA
MTDTAKFKSALEEERERVVAAIENLQAGHPGTMEDETGEINSSGADNHLADAATVTYDRELDQGLEDSADVILTKIDAALKKIDEGTYGMCESCGQPIGEERLEAVPWATLCIDCKRKEEQG